MRRRDLGFSNGDRQWIITAYSLAFGSLLLLGGRLADDFGRKRVFLAGVIGFAVASAAGGAATSFGMLVAARAVQGAFGALLAPAALSLLTTTFTEPRERGKAFGIYGGIAGAGASLGLLLGGVLTEYLDWRWTMYVNIVFAVVAAAGGIVLLAGHVAGELRERIDKLGAAARLWRHVRDRLRLRPRRHQVGQCRLGRGADDRLPRGRAGHARRVRARGAARRPPVAAAARPHRPQPRRRLLGDVPRLGRHVRGLPLPHLLPGDDPRLQPDQGRAGVPAHDRHRHRQCRGRHHGAHQPGQPTVPRRRAACSSPPSG